MRTRRQAAGVTALFLVVVPGSVGGLVPWLLTRWRMAPSFLGWDGLRWLGAALIVAGGGVLLDAFWRFVRDGAGTPAPIYPTERLVVTGLYRHVRNPMYLGMAAIVFGQAVLLGNAALMIYAVAVSVGFHVFVRLHEEPSLARRHGPQFARYRAAVRRWLPRLTPWHDTAANVEGD